MTKKTSQYNSSLVTPSIAYDKKVSEWVWEYIVENLWKHMDKDWVKKAVFVLDDPLQEYGNDREMIKQVLKSFLPKVKKMLKIDDEHPLKDRIKIPLRREWLIDNDIKQQLNLYINNKIITWSIVEVFQEGPKRSYWSYSSVYEKINYGQSSW